MPVLGYNITKVDVERDAQNIASGQVEVKLSPRIKELRLGEVRTPTGKVTGIEVLFAYEISYNPQIARAVIEGSILYLPPQKDKTDEILNIWEEEKKVDSRLFVEVINFLSVQLLPMLTVIAKEMRLPYHIPVPRAELRTQ
ncbi:hypothetical protein TEU_08670 [Thermococcus eurythermalis]|uniref:Preprotein translocase subunit SecB n=1 Tax=Thermococcus eurythermalis TaxID=1505907 RepID=A0A097QV93_9EURY|nr:hypothetical protein [Thermococcus eurythermalis]AIU70396.1 hypothetical protein TEU_08670 [Thermococcus eurythermalis]